MSSTSSAAVTLITGTNAGAQVPYISEWVQGSTTATYTLIGQILDNGETNFVGYDEDEAYYLLTTSAPNAVATTLEDGQSYYFTSGDPPSGYLATEGDDSASQTSSGGASISTSDESTSMSEMSATETRSSGTSGSSSPTSDESASAQTSQPGTGSQLSIISFGVGMTLFTALVFSVLG